MTRLADRVKEVSSTTGVGAFALGGAAVGFRGFLAALGAGPVYYTIQHQTVGDWEVGIGTLSAGPDTLARTTILASSNAGAAVSFSSGLKDVFCSIPAIAIPPPGTGLRVLASAYPAAYTNRVDEVTLATFTAPALGANSEFRVESIGHWNIPAGGGFGSATWKLAIDGAIVATFQISGGGVVVQDTGERTTVIIRNRGATNAQFIYLERLGLYAATVSQPYTLFATGAYNWTVPHTLAILVQCAQANPWSWTANAITLYQNGP